MRALLVDDDRGLGSLLREYLGAHGVEVEQVEEGASGLARVGTEPFDVVLLDVMLPGEDGFSLLPKFRAQGSAPVIMLTARGDDDDRVRGLELGADDYLAKPFNPRELLLRMKAVLRRTEIVPAPSESERIVLGAVEVLAAAHSVLVDGKTVDLTSFEFRLVLALARKAGTPVSREELAHAVGLGESYDPSVDRSLDVHVSHLRQKLEEDPRDPRRIKTVRGVGYVFARPT
jgi:DNA-binding response OmpR family regulator